MPPTSTTQLISKSSNAAFDVVGEYQQDQVNGFDSHLLDRFREIVDPSEGRKILDAMAGDGNLTLRILEKCEAESLGYPDMVVMEYSSVQADRAKTILSRFPVRVFQGNILTMSHDDSELSKMRGSFDRIVIKSANHEIPAHLQEVMYENIYHMLKPGGSFINLGMLFNGENERDEICAIARVKDSLAGLFDAVKNRHFLTSQEYYQHLNQAGFKNIRSEEKFNYSIRAKIVAENYKLTQRELEKFINVQKSSKTMCDMQMLRFEGNDSLMTCPGEITVARRPTLHEENIETMRRYPMDFLRQIEAHRHMLDSATDTLIEGNKVLDVGCGIGLLAERMPENTSYTGVDLSKEFIEITKDRFNSESQFNFFQTDYLEHQSRETYDKVYLLNVLNLPGVDSLAWLKKAKDSLSMNGSVVITGPVSRESFSHAEPHILEQLQRDGHGADRDEWLALAKANRRLLSENGNYWSAEGMVQLLMQLGFNNIKRVRTDLYYGYAYLIEASV